MQREVIPRKDLSHADGDELFLGIDEEVGVEDTAPGVAADGGDFGRLARGCGDTEAETELVAVVGEGTGEGTDLVGRHLGDGFGLQQAVAIELATVKKHLQKAGVVADGGNETGAARVKFALIVKWIS